MPDLLFDTNIVIYVFGEHPTYLHFLRTTADKTVGISVMTYMEMMMGVDDEREMRATRAFLDRFEIIPLDTDIAIKSAAVFRKRKLKNLRHPRFADTIIAETALSLGIPLVTNNPKDFAGFAGLKTIIPE